MEPIPPPPAPIMTEEQAADFEYKNQIEALNNALSYINTYRTLRGLSAIHLAEHPGISS